MTDLSVAVAHHKAVELYIPMLSNKTLSWQFENGCYVIKTIFLTMTMAKNHFCLIHREIQLKKFWVAWKKHRIFRFFSEKLVFMIFLPKNLDEIFLSLSWKLSFDNWEPLSSDNCQDTVMKMDSLQPENPTFADCSIDTTCKSWVFRLYVEFRLPHRGTDYFFNHCSLLLLFRS